MLLLSKIYEQRENIKFIELTQSILYSLRGVGGVKMQSMINLASCTEKKYSKTSPSN